MKMIVDPLQGKPTWKTFIILKIILIGLLSLLGRPEIRNLERMLTWMILKLQTYAQGANCKNLISICYFFPEQKKSYLLKLEIMVTFF